MAKSLYKTLTLGLIGLLVVILINWAGAQLPMMDTTDKTLLTPSTQAMAVLRSLESPVTLTLVAEAGQEDAYIQALLQRMTNRQVAFQQLAPGDPSLAPYSHLALESGAVIVASGNRSHVLSAGQLYEYDMAYDYYSSSYVLTDQRLALEDRVIRAIQYVTQDLPIAYVLTGHGEPLWGDSFRQTFLDAQVALLPLNLEEAGTVPEDTDLLLIHAPAKDLRTAEIDALKTYLQAGGDLILSTDTTIGPLSRLNALLNEYGMNQIPGLVLENDSSKYYQTYKQYLLPTLGDHPLLEQAAAETWPIALPLGHGIEILPSRGTLSHSALLTLGESAYRKINLNALTTLDQEDGDANGPFTLAMLATEGETNILWLATANFLEDNSVQVSGGANIALFETLLASLVPVTHGEGYAIHSLAASYLSWTQVTSILALAIWILLPTLLLLFGLIKAFRRRKA